MCSQDKAQLINELRQNYALSDLLRIAKIKRSTYYYQINRLKLPDKYKKIKEMINDIFNAHKGRYGYRRITMALKKQGYLINHKVVQRLMQQLDLKSNVRVKRYRSYRGIIGKVAPNLLNRQFTANKPNQKWVTDITEFNVLGQKLYLSPILDLYNGEIISYSIAKQPLFEMIENMLLKAFKRLDKIERPILHSDQGWQYQITPYQHILAKKQITPSMSRKGNCLDNAVIENFFGILKSEFFYKKKFTHLDQLEIELNEYIQYYNNDRIKIKLGGLSPIQFRTQSLTKY